MPSSAAIASGPTAPSIVTMASPAACASSARRRRRLGDAAVADPAIGEPLPFAEAIAWARARQIVLPAVYYGELHGLARQNAFTISGLAGLEQIQQVHDSLVEVIETGVAFREWQRHMLEQPDIGELGPALIETIGRNAIQQSYNRGRYEQQAATVASHPYYMYDAVDDSRTRAHHAAMDGFVARHDDATWSTWTPACGHRCRCRRIALTERQAQRYAEQDLEHLADADRARARTAALRDGPDAGWGYDPYQDPAAGLRHAIDQRRAHCTAALAAPGTCQLFAGQLLNRLEARLAAGWNLTDLLEQSLGRAYPDLEAAARPWAEQHGLPITQAVSARAVTDYATSRQVNRVLWWTEGRTAAGLPADPERIGPLIQSLLGLFRAAPPALTGERLVHRGLWRRHLPPGWLDAHQPGRLVQWHGIGHTAAPQGQTLGTDLLAIIRQRSGVDIAGVSLYPEQGEILLPPGITLRVRRAQGAILELEEVADPPLLPSSQQFAATPP